MRGHPTHPLLYRARRQAWLEAAVIACAVLWIGVVGAMWMLSQRLKALEVKPMATALYWSCPAFDRFGPSCQVGTRPVPGWYSGIVAPDLD